MTLINKQTVEETLPKEYDNERSPFYVPDALLDAYRAQPVFGRLVLTAGDAATRFSARDTFRQHSDELLEQQLAWNAARRARRSGLLEHPTIEVARKMMRTVRTELPERILAQVIRYCLAPSCALHDTPATPLSHSGLSAQ